MTTSSMAFSADARRALLDELFAIGVRIDTAPAGDAPDPADVARYAALRRAYREQLPMLAVSRCPFTQTVITHSLDPFGIDGPWWDHRAPNRPLELMMQGTVLAFTGALTMDTTIESAPFLVRPGPGAPFVVPRLLAREGVRAVIRSLAIGAHLGYVVMYFAEPAPDDLEGYNDWGLDHYQFESDVDRIGWHQGSATTRDHDFDLAPYLKSGQLLWIAPNDETMTLRNGIAECPYIDAEGCRVPQFVQDGERWLGEFEFDDDTVVILDQDTVEDEASDTEAVAGAVTEPQSLEPPPVPVASVPLAPVPLAPVPLAPVPSAPAAPPVVRSAVAPSAPPREVAPSVAPSAAPTSAPRCAACNGQLKLTSKFCPGCGAPVVTSAAPEARSAPTAQAANTCRHCGAARRPEAKFCRSCGKP